MCHLFKNYINRLARSKYIANARERFFFFLIIFFFCEVQLSLPLSHCLMASELLKVQLGLIRMYGLVYSLVNNGEVWMLRKLQKEQDKGYYLLARSFWSHLPFLCFFSCQHHELGYHSTGKIKGQLGRKATPTEH